MTFLRFAYIAYHGVVYGVNSCWQKFKKNSNRGDSIAYVPVPKDLTNVKTQFLFNLTKRQLVCFGSGALIGVPLFFMLKTPLGTSTAALIMVFVMLPFFLLAMYERNGQPLEKVVRNMANVLFIRPKQRPYRTNNFYSCLMKQDNLNKEVYAVIYGKKTHKKREKAD